MSDQLGINIGLTGLLIATLGTDIFPESTLAGLSVVLLTASTVLIVWSMLVDLGVLPAAEDVDAEVSL